MLRGLLVNSVFWVCYAVLGGAPRPLKAHPTRHITVATEAAYPPFEYVAPSGEIEGFDVAIIKALCREAGITCTVVNHSFESLILGVQVGKFDAAIAAINITPARQQQVGFTDPYYVNAMGCIMLPEAPSIDFSDISQLVGKRIGVQAGTTFEQYILQAYGTVAEVRRYTSNTEALLDLDNGRIDLVVGDMPLLHYWSCHNQEPASQIPSKVAVGYKVQKITMDVAADNQLGIAVRKGNEDLLRLLNQALGRLKAQGVLDQLAQQHLTPAQPSSSTFLWQLVLGTRLTLLMGLGALIMGLVVASLMAAAAWSPYRVIRGTNFLFQSLIRGLPELIVLFMVYYGGTYFLSTLWGRSVEVSAWAAGVTGLSLIFASYAAEVLQGALRAVSLGQQQVALALGLSRYRTFLNILLPQLWRHALPGLNNLWLVLLKDTALVSLLGLADLMNKAQLAAATTHKPFSFYFVAAIIYLLLTLLSQAGVKWLSTYAKR